jgi:hypothetical protein
MGGTVALAPGYFQGKLDEVRIYDHALSSTEIQNVMSTAISTSMTGGFAITGVTGGTDSVVDEFLTSGTQPTIHWSSALAGSSYQVTVYESDGTTVKCAQASTTATTYSFSSSSCNLSAGTYYKAKVTAVGSNGVTTDASNSLYSFYTGIGVGPVYPNHGANWMDYVKNDGTDVYSATDTTCTGSETHYYDCIHGGEKRKVATWLTSCSGLSLSDSLGAFDWSCSVTSGNAVFYSTGFKTGKGLRDLLNATSWKSNQVTLSGAANATSDSIAWWTNPVSALPDNSGASDSLIDLDGSVYPGGTILTLSTSRATGGYDMATDRLGIVTLGSSVLSYNGNSSVNCNGGVSWCMILDDASFGWVEVNLDGSGGGGTDADHGIWDNSIFARTHNSTVINAGTGFRGGSMSKSSVTYLTVDNVANTGVYLANDAHDNVFRHVYATSSQPNWTAGFQFYNGAYNNSFFDISASYFTLGIEMQLGATGNLFNQVRIYNNGGAGIRLFDTATSDNRFIQVLIQGNNWEGIGLSQATNNIFAQITAANNGDAGTLLDNGADQNTIHQVLSINNGSGIAFNSTANSDSDTFDQVATLDNTNYGASLDANADNAQFSGVFLVGNNATSDCQVSGGTNAGLSDGTCTTTGADGSSTYTAGFLSDAILRTNRSAASSVVGKLSTGDSVNSSDDTTGSATFPATFSTFDWLNFESFFRLWGLDGSAFPNSDHQGQWTTGTGRIWDWQLRATDTVLLNRSGDGSAANAAFIAGAACPAAADGDAVTTDQQSTPHQYLLNAVEIVDPEATGYSSSGNHNGLCESNEHCIYTPNFGAYQGHESLNTCIFNDGTVSGVTLYGYSANGV